MKFMITGGAGFIGSAVVRHLIEHSRHEVLNFDALTYAGDTASLCGVSKSPRYKFVKGDIRDVTQVQEAISGFSPDVIMNLAAETHVDRSISEPFGFIETNIIGTYTLLDVAKSYWEKLPPSRQNQFRFHQVSTDEVYGSLEGSGLFAETSPYAPNSPYAASKASADHLVRAWHRTYGLPILTSNCSNNYGPWQFPEKLIPRMITNALCDLPLPVYGKGDQVRDWLYVDDHAEALVIVATKGRPGEVYNIGGAEEHTNISVVEALCKNLDDIHPSSAGSYSRLISHVADRAGHDRRYAIDSSKVCRELGWAPARNFALGLRNTVEWYVGNEHWWRPHVDAAKTTIS